MTEESSTSHWNRFGFSDDPYHVGHLPVERISRSLFVGHHTDYDRLLTFIKAYPTGKTMIEGLPGVGKTSLVNVVQQTLYESSERFPLFEPIETPIDGTRESFLLTAMSALVSSLRVAFGELELGADPRYRAARDAVTQTIQSMAAGTFQASFALAGLGLGAGAGSSHIAQVPLGITAPTLVELLRGLVALVQERGFKGVVLPVNNLDTFDSEKFIKVFNAVRDVCSAIQGVHWAFIAGAGAFGLLESAARRVSETFTSNPIAVAALSWDEVAEALERRRANFALDPQVQLPISERIGKLVYEASGGELRFTFARLSRTVLEFSARFPSELTIPDELALALLSEWGQGQLERHHLAPREREVMEHVRAHGVIRARDHSKLGIQRSQHLSQLLRGLEEKQYLAVVVRGTAREYGLSRPAALAYLTTHSRALS